MTSVMQGNPPTEVPALEIRHDDPDFWNGIPLHQVHVLINVDEHHFRWVCIAQNAMPSYITGLLAQLSIREEMNNPELQHDNDQQVASPSQEPEGTLGHALVNDNLSSIQEVGALEEAIQPAIGGEQGSDEVPPVHSEITRMWMAMIIVGILHLIMVPGLVLGLATRQAQGGIALSGAIGTVLGVFAGLDYHRRRRN